MRDADRPILEILSESGLALRATSIKYNLQTRYNEEIAEATMYRRLKTLTYAGLLDKEDDTFYSITDLGQRYLNSDLSDEEVAEVSQRLQEDPDD